MIRAPIVDSLHPVNKVVCTQRSASRLSYGFFLHASPAELKYRILTSDHDLDKIESGLARVNSVYIFN